MKVSRVLMVIVVGALSAARVALGADWPCFRGPAHNGVSGEAGFIEQFPAGGPGVVWKASVGLGFSGVVVGGGRAYTLGFAEGNDTVFCFEAGSGKVIWKHSYPAELGDKFFEGGTTGTPTVDGERVYTLSRWGDLFCFDAVSGKIVWSRNIQKEHELRPPMWGFTGAPLVQGDLLILAAGEAGLAINKVTGKTVWQSANKEAGFSTPYPAMIGGKAAVIVSAGNAYVAVDPATGKEHWRVRWLTQYGVNAADPIVEGEHLFLSSGYGKGAGLFKLNGLADPPKEIWKSKVLRAQLNAPVLYQGHLYGADGDTTEKASFKCIELATGAQKWEQRNFGSGAAILAGGDKLIALSGDGELMIAAATPEGFKPSARAKVLAGLCWTALTLCDGRVYCRNSRGEVVCLDLRKP